MAKRFTDTEKWGDSWFRELTPQLKCLWLYLCDRCDNAGVWKVDKGLAEFQIGSKIDWQKATETFSGRCTFIKEDKLLIVGFIMFQFGELNENVNLHKNVLKMLSFHGIPYPCDTHSIPIAMGCDTHMVKDKDKVKDKDNSVSWRTDFETYKAIVDKTLFELLEDAAEIEKQEKLNPNVDIRLTLEKSVHNFWGTEAGWKNKKGARGKDINMRSTLINAISMPMNKVYKITQANKQERPMYEYERKAASKYDGI